MPVWRPRREWLTVALRSVLGQRGTRIELIVVDDGCEEPVASMLSEFDDPRLRVVRIDHAGPAGARNAGIAEARGEWFRFADADDALELDSTARLLQLAADGEWITYGATVYCDAHLRPRSKLVERRSGWLARECLLGRFRVMLPAILFPRRVVEETGGWEASLAGTRDWDFVLRCLERARARGEPEVALYYRRYEGSTSSALAAGLDGARRVVERYFERHPDERARLGRPASAMLDVIAADQATHGRPWRSARFWRAGIRDPGAIGHDLAELAARRTRRILRRPTVIDEPPFDGA